MTTKLVTFKTNHTILAGVDCKSDTEIVITKPVQVVVQPTKDGPMMGFAPFLDFAEEFNTGIKFGMENVLCITTQCSVVASKLPLLFQNYDTIYE